ncbi:rbcL, partial [Symbiodinium sp. KB8]
MDIIDNVATDQQHLVSEVPIEMLRAYVFQAVREQWGNGAISLRGLRESVQQRLGISLVLEKPAIRQLAEEAADAMSQEQSALNDLGRGRELFLSISDIQDVRMWTGVWEPLPDQDWLGNRTTTDKTLELNVDSSEASRMICETVRSLLPPYGNVCHKKKMWMHFWKYGCQSVESRIHSPLQCLGQVSRTIFKPMPSVWSMFFSNASYAFWQGGAVILTVRASQVPRQMNESIPEVEKDTRACMNETGHGKPLCPTFVTDNSSAVIDRVKFIPVPFAFGQQRGSVSRCWLNLTSLLYGTLRCGAQRYGKESSSSWELWRGSWKTASPKQQAFPSYDRAWGPREEIQVIKEERRQADAVDDSSARGVQAIVNMLRKAENRIARLQREKQEKTVRWAKYQQELKAAFVAEERRYTAAQQKYSEEVVEAEKQLATAKELLAQVASDFRTGMDTSGPTVTDEEAWNAMMRRTPHAEQTGTTDPEMIEILRRYKRGEGLPTGLPTFGNTDASRRSMSAENPRPEQHVSKAPPPPAAVSTPSPMVPRGTAPSYGCASPSVAHNRASPYPETSPTGPKLPAAPVHEPVEPHPVEEARPVESMNGADSRLHDRVPVKQRTKGPPEKSRAGATLSEKLESKRATATGDGIIDDDQDELGTASPGFGRIQSGLGARLPKVLIAHSITPFSILDFDSPLPRIPPAPFTTMDAGCSRLETSIVIPVLDFLGCEPVLDWKPWRNRPPQEDDPPGQDWLGIHLYTPHYQPLQLAIRPQEKTLESVLALLVTYDQGPDGCLFDTVVPIRPQSDHGSGSFLRFSSSIKGVGTGGMVAIIMDLTTVGGPFFSTVLPQGIAFQTLRDYFGPLTTIGDEPVDVFVGCCARPLSSDSQAHLSDGDVILVLRRTVVVPRSKQQVPCLNVDQYGPRQQIATGLPPAPLSVQGQACPFVMAVAEVPSPEVTGMNRDDARDVFVLLDPRPMGQKPCFLFLHHPVVHLPSVAAMLGLSTGRTRRLGVRGGDRRGDDVFVEGCTALVLFAEETDDASVDSGSTDRSDGLAADMSLGMGAESVAGPPGLPLQAVVYDDPSSPVGDVWGGGPQLTMEGVDILDPTLPEGQSWNADRTAARGRDTVEDYGFEELVAGPEPCHTVLAGDAEASMSAQISVLIYVPDFVPEILAVSVALPAAIEGLKAQVKASRAPEQSFSFPELYQVSPQPLKETAIFTAGPTWQAYTVMVLFDCRRCNDCIFAKAVPRTLSRESLLLAAGFPPDDPVQVFVHGLIQPLAIDQRITLVHGMTITISPRHGGSPAQYDLGEMLLTSDGWDSEALMPGPTVHFNSHFYILTEGTPFAFQVQPGRQATFREDVARATGTAEYRLSLGTVTPRITDAYPFGFWTSAVLVATDALQRVPYPPARSPERRRILVLDQRRILRGITWRFVFSRVQKVQDLADLYYDMCPPRHVVSLDGARVEVRDGVQVFLIQPGQVLTVEFVLEKSSPPPSENEQGPTDLPMRDESPTDPPDSHVSTAIPMIVQDACPKMALRAVARREDAHSLRPNTVGTNGMSNG